MESTSQSSQCQATPAAQAQPAEIQADLIEDDPRIQAKSKPDPRAKPTWEEWSKWDPFRRLLNDCRIRGHDTAFKLWHWYHNSKEKSGEVVGFRAQAEWIGEKHGWKPATVYKAIELLHACGYLLYRKGEGCKPVCTPLRGIRELPKGSNQRELPFLVPVDSSSAPKGTPEGASSAPIGRPGMPQGDSRSAPKGTPFTMCELLVTGGSVNEEPLPSSKRPKWQIDKELGTVLLEIKQLDAAQPRHDANTKAQILKALRLRQGNLERELAGLPPETSEEKAKRLPAIKPARPAKDDPAMPEIAKAWAVATRAKVNGNDQLA